VTETKRYIGYDMVMHIR